jgi:hypothetical protein
MSVDLIRYDLLVQDALRAVVRRVLTDVARDGLPGEHHLYVSFDTCAPGVRLSPRLKEKYPEEMTIVLQHQFWDLIVTETFFEVGLSFNGIAERLHVPFDSLKGFFDPSVKFGLQFEPPAASEEEDEAPTAVPTLRAVEDEKPAAPAPRPVSVPSTKPAAAKVDTAKPAAEKPSAVESASAKPANAKASGATGEAAKPAPAKGDAAKENAAKSDAAKSKGDAAKSDTPKDEPGDSSGGAQVVRLDAFRKK